MNPKGNPEVFDEDEITRLDDYLVENELTGCKDCGSKAKQFMHPNKIIMVTHETSKTDGGRTTFSFEGPRLLMMTCINCGKVQLFDPDGMKNRPQK